MHSKPEKFWRVTQDGATRRRCLERTAKITSSKTPAQVLQLRHNIVKQIFFLIWCLEKILKVPVEESDHVRTGWWIDFRNISCVEKFTLSEAELD